MKKLLIILGILLITIGGYLFWHYSSNAEDEIHLLPRDFKGIVIIRFNSPNGKDKRYEDGVRVYKIPANGILDTKFKENEGLSNLPKYYYLDGNKRTPMTKTKVYSLQFGVAASDINNKSVIFSTYIVSDEQHVDSLYNVREKMNFADVK
jgi:hypothetical protein